MHSVNPQDTGSNSWRATLSDLLAAQGGDREAMQRVMTRYHAPLLARIRVMSGPDARRAAESTDFLQQVYLEAMTSIRRLEPRDEGHFVAWLTQIARNNIRDEVRQKREELFSSFSQSAFLVLRRAESPTPSSEVVQAEEHELLVRALLRLEPDHQRVIELRAFERLSFKEIGAAMNRSADAAQRLNARAMMRLGYVLRELQAAAAEQRGDGG